MGCNQLLQSLRKGNSCSKLVTDSFKCPTSAQLFTLLPASRVLAVLFSVLHVIPEKIEAFLCAGDGVGVGIDCANPPAWMQSGTRLPGSFLAFAEIKELWEGAYSSFMVGQWVCVAKDYSASHKSIRIFQSENQNCAPSDPITGGRA